MNNDPQRRTVIIGDVHGCLAELQELLRAARVQPFDRLISVGDLICKGPNSRGVLDWAMRAPNLECVLGNHELRFLNCWRRGVVPDIKPYDRETYREFGVSFDDGMRFVSRWPLTIAENDFLVVHAGFDPRRPITRQSDVALTNMRRLKDTEEPWYERYHDERLVVFGHWARPEPVVRRNAVGLDTGCVYGGALTALILPERRLVRVPARKAYARKESWPARAAETA
jgi:serine/threonine protein phosphatase 1